MAETTTPVNLLFKYGDFSKLSSTIDQGTIYFAKDDTANHENNKGYIYYGDPTSGTKNSIIGDGYFLKNNNKFFINRSILNIGTDNIYLQQLGESLSVNGLRIIRNTSNIELVNDIQIDGELFLEGHFLPTISDAYNLGSTEFLWNSIYLNSNSYILNNDRGYCIEGNFFGDSFGNQIFHGIALFLGADGKNRGLYDIGTAGLYSIQNKPEWLLYWNDNNNSIMQINNEFNIDTLISDNLKISFNTKYFKASDPNPGYYPHSGAYLKIYGIPRYNSTNNSIIEGTYGNDLILSSGNALLLASGDGAQNFYNKYLKPPENPQISNYSRTENFFLLSDNNFFFQSNSTSDNKAVAPLTDKELNLGTSSLQWKNIYGENIYGNFIGNSSTTTKLAASVTINGTAFDGSANITTNNWGASRTITIKDSDSKNSGTSVSINGSKDYILTLPKTIKATLTGNASTATTLKTARTITVHGEPKDFDGSGDITFTIRDATDSQSGVVSTGAQKFAGQKSFNTIIPVEDSTYQLGSSKYRWKETYTDMLNVSVPTAKGVTGVKSQFSPYKNNTLQIGNTEFKWQKVHCSGTYSAGNGLTSDKRLKIIPDNYLDILEKDLKLYDQIKTICYQYKDILPEDHYNRIHIGFIAQDIEQLILENDLSNQNCAFIQKEPLEDGNLYTSVCKDKYLYYLNYNEFHGLHLLKNHQQDERITNLENQIANLKTQLELLKLSIGG